MCPQVHNIFFLKNVRGDAPHSGTSKNMPGVEDTSFLIFAMIM